MKLWVLLTSCLLLSSNGSANPQDKNLAKLMLRDLEDGVALHGTTDRDMHLWWKDFKESMATLEKEKEGLVCTNPDLLLEQLRLLQATIIKIRVQWKLKKTQLKELKDVLDHKDYKNTGLSKDAGECKDIDDYINTQNTTTQEEDIKLTEEEKQVIDLFTWIAEYPCDCVWGEWQPWTGCSKTCGGGIQSQERIIAKSEKNGGAKCPGKSRMERGCNEEGCPFNCVWKPWTEWTPCPEDCVIGGNNQVRSREFEEHRNGGLPCQGPTTEKKPCFIVPILKTEIGKQQEEINRLKKSLKDCEGGKLDLALTVGDLEEKLCSLLNCRNGGICLKGSCQCLDQFTGPTCEEEKNPSHTVTCSFTADNHVHKVLYNGNPLTITGDVNNYAKEKTVSFQSKGCGALQIVAEDQDKGLTNHCIYGGMMLHCTSMNAESNWNNFKSDETNWIAEDNSQLCSNEDGFFNHKAQFMKDLISNGAKKIWTDKKKVALIGTPAGCPPINPPTTVAPITEAPPAPVTDAPLAPLTTAGPGHVGDGKCADGFKLNMGDIFGFGNRHYHPNVVNDLLTGVSSLLTGVTSKPKAPNSNQECAQKCNDYKHGSCCAYEWYPSKKWCHLNTKCNPGKDHDKGQQYCQRMGSTECADGFELIPGDIKGWGNTIGSFTNVQSTDDCAKKCNHINAISKRGGCCSYEWSPLSKKCNLNRQCNPEKDQYLEYRFCVQKRQNKISAGTLPRQGKFVIMNKGTGKTIRQDGSGVPKLSDMCDHTNEFILYRPVAGGYGALKPAYRDMIMSVETKLPSIVIGRGLFGLPKMPSPKLSLGIFPVPTLPTLPGLPTLTETSHVLHLKPMLLSFLANQKFKMEGDCIVSHNIVGKALVMAAEGDKIVAEESSDVKCDKPNQQWEILDSCP